MTKDKKRARNRRRKLRKKTFATIGGTLVKAAQKGSSVVPQDVVSDLIIRKLADAS